VPHRAAAAHQNTTASALFSTWFFSLRYVTHPFPNSHRVKSAKFGINFQHHSPYKAALISKWNNIAVQKCKVRCNDDKAMSSPNILQFSLHSILVRVALENCPRWKTRRKTCLIINCSALRRPIALKFGCWCNMRLRIVKSTVDQNQNGRQRVIKCEIWIRVLISLDRQFIELLSFRKEARYLYKSKGLSTPMIVLGLSQIRCSLVHDLGGVTLWKSLRRKTNSKIR